MKHITVSDCLRDGKYVTTANPKWHHKFRIKLAYWLLNSLPKDSHLEIEIRTG